MQKGTENYETDMVLVADNHMKSAGMDEHLVDPIEDPLVRGTDKPDG